MSLRTAVEALERRLILEAVERAGTWAGAASALGISLRTIFYKRRAYGLGHRVRATQWGAP